MPSSDDYIERRRNDSRLTSELVKSALEQEGDAAWEPVVVLHYRATPDVLAEAQRLCRSHVTSERTLGANILGQLGVPERAFPEECFSTLAAMLSHEDDTGVLEAIGVAFGHLNDKRAVQLLAPLSKHHDSDVRFGVVRGLSGHEDKLAMDTLIELTTDSDDDVRNWSTFALGTLIDSDSAEIRTALLERVTDAHDETRGEALLGLARRKDPRALEALVDELGSDQVGMLALEAAAELADPRLLPALKTLDQEWKGDQDKHLQKLQDALLRCSAPRLN